MQENLRYVTSRLNKRDGSLRWYWQRRGCSLTRLPDNRAERVAEVDRLNSQADTGARCGPVVGSLAWVIDGYRSSPKFTDLARSTKRHYERWLGEIEALGPARPFAKFDRQCVVDLIESKPKLYEKQELAAVLYVLFDYAMYRGVVSANLASKLRLSRPPARDRVWSDDEIARWFATAETVCAPQWLVTAATLLISIAQRPGDVLALTWPQFDGRAIGLRQEKTGKLVKVPLLPEALERLARVRPEVPRNPTGTIVANHGSRHHGAVVYKTFNQHFLTVCRAAGIDAQARDLRRTAMVRMALAGCTTPMIASVSGHSIESTQRILDTYLPRHTALAEEAIARVAAYQSRTRV